MLSLAIPPKTSTSSFVPELDFPMPIPHQVGYESSDIDALKLFLETPDQTTLCNYYMTLFHVHLLETNTLDIYRTITTLPTPRSATTRVIRDVGLSPTNQVGITVDEVKYISLSEAVTRQRAIHERLKREIDEGLAAEAQYWKYLDDDTTED